MTKLNLSKYKNDKNLLQNHIQRAYHSDIINVLKESLLYLQIFGEKLVFGERK